MSNPWGLKDIKPGSMQSISEDKLATFAVGQQKKSRFQKAREEAEERKRQEELEASKIYDTFVASFEGSSDSKTFVRAGAATGDRSGPGKAGEVYKLAGRTEGAMSAAAGSGKPLKEMDRMLQDFKERDNERSRGGSSTRDWISGSKVATVSKGSTPELVISAGGLRGKPKGEIDAFLSEIMNNDGGRDSMAASVNAPGSHDTGDGSTTNLYVGNLPPGFTEARLLQLFGAFGPINSVKIMWPRTPEEKAKTTICGFVSFLKRRDAEDAKDELDALLLEGNRLSVGWGKAVKINDAPLPMPGAQLQSWGPPPPSIHTRMPPTGPGSAPPPPPGVPPLPSQLRPPPPGSSGWLDHRPPIPSGAPLPDNEARMVVRVPERAETRAIIDLTAQYVAADGEAFEQTLKSRLQGDRRYEFLFNPLSQEGVYYRWRTFAFVMGDNSRQWREEPFVMDAAPNAPLWVPPRVPDSRRSRSRSHSRSRSRGRRQTISRRSRSRSRERDRDRYRKDSRSRSRSPHSRNHSRGGGRGKDGERDRYAGMTGAQIERERAKARRSKEVSLTDAEYDEFDDILLNLTLSRKDILNGMAFALDFADMALEVAEMLRKSLLSMSTPMPLKIARLYLLSDILHNSGSTVKGATAYRMALQACLPEIFGHLSKAYRCITGRMTARQVEERVLSLLDVWSQWSILSPVFLWGLEAVFRMSDADWSRMSIAADEIVEGVAAPADDELDWERLQRRARIAGVSELQWVSLEGKESDRVSGPLQEVAAVPVVMTNIQLYRLLAYVTEFVKTKTITEEAAYRPSVDTADDEPATAVAELGSDIPSVNAPLYSDDIDGIPLGETIDIDGVPLGDTIDIDGVPLGDTNGADGASISGQYFDSSNADEVDIDGIPLQSNEAYDEIDGIPMAIPTEEIVVDPGMLAHVERQVAQYREALLACLGDAPGVDDLIETRRAELIAACGGGTWSGRRPSSSKKRKGSRSRSRSPKRTR